MRRLRLLVAGLVVVAALGAAGPALGLPANPWSGNWRTNTGDLVTLTQTGSQITVTSLRANTTSLPGVTFTAIASGDGSVATSDPVRHRVRIVLDL